MNKTYRYHRTEKPKLVDMDDTEKLEALEDAGWKDSPAAFLDSEVEDSEPEQEPEGDRAEFEELLGRFNEDPQELDKDELVALGRYLGVNMMKAWKVDTLIEKVRSSLE